MSKAFISATKFEVSINKAALLNSITANRNGKITGLEVRSYILPIMEEAQKDLIKDFHKHSVTKELKGGASASNSSGTLGGYGNLFSFIGFERGANPTVSIDKILREKLQVTVRAIGNGRFRISILNAPSKQDIFESTPLPWANGSSWTEGIEKGMSNLGSFLYSSGGISGSSNGSRSRSGKGIQTKNDLRATNFKTTPYISNIMDKFLKRIITF